MSMTDEEIARDEAMDEFAREVEKTWKNPRLSTEELKEVFPEILEIAPQRVRQLEFWIEKLEIHYAENRLYGNSLEVLWERDRREEEIKRLRTQLRRFSKFLPQGRVQNGVSDAQIDDAMEYPITDLVDGGRRSGHTMKVLCPMHEERTPSCNIYTDQNTFWCFGCNKGGNVINFLMAQEDIDFVTAVRQLTGGSNESIVS